MTVITHRPFGRLSGAVFSMRKSWRRLFARLPALSVAFFLVCFSVPDGAAAEDAGSALERSVKAAFLYKFLGYVEWPPGSFAESGSPITIGVIGADDIAAELTQIAAGRTVNSRALAVRRLADGDPLAGLHLVFIGQTDGARLGRLLKSAQQRSLLTVTESDDALGQGSVINFKLTGGRIRFDVSLEAAEKANLKLSSRLLSVAHYVQKGS